MFRLLRTSWTERLVIAAATALAGVMTMVAILLAIHASNPSAATMMTGAGSGAGLSGLLFATFFGRRGSSRGWLLAILASVLSTGLGSFLGGVIWAGMGFLGIGPDTLSVPSMFEGIIILLQAGGTAFLVVMYLSPAEFPYLLVIWAMLMAGVHGAAILIRQRTAA